MKALKMMMAVVLMAAATLALAQQRKNAGATAQVPFAFQAAGKSLPAGEYQIKIQGKTMMLVGDSGQVLTMITHPVEAKLPAEKSELEFVKVNGTYQLARMRRVGRETGLELNLSNVEHKLARNTDITRVAVGQ